MSSLKDLRAMMKDRAAEGDDLAKIVLDHFGDKPDSLLLRFLRARKFDVVRSHELMKGEPETSSHSHGVRMLRFSFCRHFSFAVAAIIECETSFVLLVCMNPVHL